MDGYGVVMGSIGEVPGVSLCRGEQRESRERRGERRFGEQEGEERKVKVELGGNLLYIRLKIKILLSKLRNLVDKQKNNYDRH